ncbi:helix-turn-helix domain-containing protein [Actinacidiphila rubida]|uniref:Helix-turn-helix domain-containing protein n=1 Tax=Actinacidiphila rubida TaxID=310780 RepID=A0A1H8TR28_9ACTN|nr:helix-turn-helix transcriptional regulator [Actinacidiphila rubida]SEO93321.1 Helix-turn-helix domain-containing protein [Actinacidiphila rubida]
MDDRCPDCSAHLSRYSDQPRCAACTRANPLPAALWTNPRLAAALAEWDFGSLFRHLREVSGISQGALAELTGLSQGTISQLENGARRLTHIDRVREVLRALQVPDHISPLTPTPAPAQAVWESPADVALRLTDTLATNTDPSALTAFSTAVHDVIAHYDTHGPAVLAPDLLRLRRQLQRLLEGRQPPVLRTGLFRLAGQIAALLSYMAVNADRPLLSDAYSVEAMALATEAGDLDLIMWIHGTRSLRHYYAGNYKDSLQAATTGLELDPHSPQAIRLLANGQGRALARLGDRHAAHRALARAETLSDRHDVPNALTPCISLEPYGLTRTRANAATVHLALGETPRVLLLAAQLTADPAAPDPWSRALVTLDAATAHLDTPDVEQAMALGAAAIQQPASPPILSVVTRAKELAHRAHANWPASPAVVAYAETLRSWSATPAVTSLGAPATMIATTTTGKAPARADRPSSRPDLVPRQSTPEP